MGENALERSLKQRLREGGPLTVEAWMGECLAAYYGSRDPFGQRGDFTTAPEISQMFGEMIGLWCAVVWQSMGSPGRVVLAEIGPGRGTLMADLLRAAATVPAFAAALDVWLVETSPALEARQRQTLAGRRVSWARRFEDLPNGPLLLVANELFDALPIRQFVKVDGRWRERMVGLDPSGALEFQPGPEAEPPMPPDLLEAPEGSVLEVCPQGRRLAGLIGQRLTFQGGAALIIDYGHGRSAAGDTLQAVRAHQYCPVLADPDACDLTAHVDFEALAAAAVPARAWGVVTQGDFLHRLGIITRGKMLAQAAPDKAQAIESQLLRLIDPGEMGTLFKVLGLAHPALPMPPGLE